MQVRLGVLLHEAAVVEVAPHRLSACSLVDWEAAGADGAAALCRRVRGRRAGRRRARRRQAQAGGRGGREGYRVRGGVVYVVVA